MHRAQGEAHFDPTETSALFRLGELDDTLDVADASGGCVIVDRGRNEALGYPLIRQTPRGDIEPLHGLPAYLERLMPTADSRGTLPDADFAAFGPAPCRKRSQIDSERPSARCRWMDCRRSARPPEQTVELAPDRPSRGTRLSEGR